MTRLERARIVKGAFKDVPPVGRPLLTPTHARRVAREVLDAREEAARVTREAEERAAALVAEARRAAKGIAAQAAEEAREAEEAKYAARYLRLRDDEERRADADLDRAVALAVALAERLLGAALRHDPQHVVGLARQALAEARGARRVTIEASPLDADVLTRHLVDAALGFESVEVRADPTLSRGSLRLSTSLGNLDAQIRPQLERLARALRDTLRHG